MKITKKQLAKIIQEELALSKEDLTQEAQPWREEFLEAVHMAWGRAHHEMGVSEEELWNVLEEDLNKGRF